MLDHRLREWFSANRKDLAVTMVPQPIVLQDDDFLSDMVHCIESTARGPIVTKQGLVLSTGKAGEARNEARLPLNRIDIVRQDNEKRLITAAPHCAMTWNERLTQLSSCVNAFNMRKAREVMQMTESCTLKSLVPEF